MVATRVVVVVVVFNQKGNWYARAVEFSAVNSSHKYQGREIEKRNMAAGCVASSFISQGSAADWIAWACTKAEYYYYIFCILG